MSKRYQKSSPISPADKRMTHWKVESIVSIDDRGQMVLPKELRDRAKILPGDKLALVSWEKESEIYCLYLIKSEYLADQVNDFLGPMMREMTTG